MLTLEKAHNQIINLAKGLIQEYGGISQPILALGYLNLDKLALLDTDENMGRMLNTGKGKDALFGALRSYIQETGAVQCIIATEAWIGKLLPEATENLGMDYFRHKSVDQIVEAGLAIRLECLVVSAQDQTTAIICQVPFERDEKTKTVEFGEPQSTSMPIDNFNGRQKMFGDLSADNLW